MTPAQRKPNHRTGGGGAAMRKSGQLKHILFAAFPQHRREATVIPRTGRAVHLPKDAAQRDANVLFYRLELTAAAADRARDNGDEELAATLSAHRAALLATLNRIGQEVAA